MPSPPPFSPFYSFWFTIVDPILTVAGIAGNLFFPATALTYLNPDYHNPPAPETVWLLDTGAGWFAAVLVLQVGLLRARPDDVTVWWYYAAAVGVVDNVICAAILKTLITQGRLGLESWRSEECINFGLTAVCALVRWAFVLGIGVCEEESKDKKI